MKVAYFEPDSTKHQKIIYGAKQSFIVNAPPTDDESQFKSVLNFDPSLNNLKDQGFSKWIHFDKSLIDSYLDGGKNDGKVDHISSSGNGKLSLIDAAIADRKNMLGKLKSKKGKNSGEDVKRIYLKLKYEAFVQGYLCYFEYNVSEFSTDTKKECRIIYFDWGILDSNVGLTIFLNPIHQPSKYDSTSAKSGGYQNSKPAVSTSDGSTTDPQQPPPPPPPTRNDSV